MTITKFVNVGNSVYLCVPKTIRDQLKLNRKDVWLINAPTSHMITYKLLTPRVLKSLQQSERRILEKGEH